MVPLGTKHQKQGFVSDFIVRKLCLGWLAVWSCASTPAISWDVASVSSGAIEDDPARRRHNSLPCSTPCRSSRFRTTRSSRRAGSKDKTLSFSLQGVWIVVRDLLLVRLLRSTGMLALQYLVRCGWRGHLSTM